MMDIMYFGTTPVLYVVDDQTKFSAAAFLPSASTNDIWSTFLKCCATIYTGLANRIMVAKVELWGRAQSLHPSLNRRTLGLKQPELKHTQVQEFVNDTINHCVTHTESYFRCILTKTRTYSCTAQ